MEKNNENQKDTENQCRSVPPPHLSSHQQVKVEFAFFLTNLSQGVFGERLGLGIKIAMQEKKQQ